MRTLVGQSNDTAVIASDDATDPGFKPERGGKDKVWKVIAVNSVSSKDAAGVDSFFCGASLSSQLEVIRTASHDLALSALQSAPDTAVTVINLTAETEQSAWKLIGRIRNELNLTDVRILLQSDETNFWPDTHAMRSLDVSALSPTPVHLPSEINNSILAAARTYDRRKSTRTNMSGITLLAEVFQALSIHKQVDAFATEFISQLQNFIEAVEKIEIYLQQRGAAFAPALITSSEAAALESRRRNSDQATTEFANVLNRAWHTLANVHYGTHHTLFLGDGTGQSLLVAFKSTDSLSPDTQQYLSILSRHGATCFENITLRESLHNFGFQDPLTKLPNRTRLKELLKLAFHGSARAHSTLALVDIDHFAETNDALGHKFGDQLLLAVAARLVTHFGVDASVSRVSGDSFGILGHNSKVTPSALTPLFAQPYKIDAQEIQLSATTGFLNLQDCTGGPSDAIKDAYIALKRAKQLQRAGHFYFSRSMGEEVRERIRLMHALRDANAQNELFVVYQPQLDLTTRRPVGAEALLRWKTRSGEFITPDRFIPIAEYSGLINEIGERVLRDACLELVRLQALGFRDFTISVNVSLVQFRNPRFLDTLRAVLSETKAPARFLELEITESIAMEDPEKLGRILAQVKDIGAAIAIDDFGTGFSSLSYLQRLRADRLKIDRSFVNEITNPSRSGSIAKMIIQLGRTLGMPIVAEGVETEHQAQVLTALGCPIGQGYLFTRPLLKEQLAPWLKERGAR